VEGAGLGQGEAFDLGAESVDLSLDLTWPEGIAGPGQGGFAGRGELVGCDQALIGTAGGIVSFDDLGSDPRALDELLLGEEEIGVPPVDGPDPVQQCQYGVGVEPQVADQFADVGPVLLLDVAAVVLVAGSGTGEGDLACGAPLEEVGVDELAAVVRVDPEEREREGTTGLLAIERSTVQPVTMSVIVRVKQISPKGFPPS
jgi:hypothetical protein